MQVTEAMYLASEMISRANAGEASIAMLKAMGTPYYKPDTSGVEQALDVIMKDIPGNVRYAGVVKTLTANKDKPGVEETLGQLYQKYPELKEGSKDSRPAKA